MLAALGRLIHRYRWLSLLLILLLTAGCGIWGSGVLGKFKQGGFEDPKASSTLVAKLGATYFGSTNPDVLLLYRSDTMTVDDPRFMAAVIGTVSRLPQAHVDEFLSYWSFDDESAGKTFASRDRHTTVVSVKIAGADDPAKLANYTAIKDRFAAPGLHTEVGGLIPLGSEFNEQVVEDIVRAETISLPILLVLLAVVFGALIAAVLPLLVGVFSIIGGLAVLHVVTYAADVTAMALEVVTMMGVGLAIDYSLFIVSRFREERAKDDDRERALADTMATAGRTIVVSGVTVTAALSGLLLFPQMFLRTIGLAGMATVMVAVFGAVVLLPTLLALLGPKVELGRMPWRRRRAARRAANPDSGFWYRLGQSVMRRPLPYFAVTLAILGVLFGPFLNVQFGAVDARVLPADSPTRAVAETVKREFPNGSAEPIDVVISGELIPRNWRPIRKDDLIPPYLEGFRQRLAKLPHVQEARFSGYSSGYGAVRISVTHGLEPMSATAQSLVQTIRQMTLTKDGLPMHIDVGGSTAAQLDLMNSLTRTLPKMGLLVGGLTFVLLFMFFGSVLLPLKAIAMNVLSIGASFGVIVWGFQYGHLAGLLGFTPVGSVEATSMVMVLAVVFGLSMDYEVFLLSRVREEWERTRDNRVAVAVGMQRTGGIITSAALLFLIVIAGFGMAGITVVKLIGVGMFVAVVVDAVLVRSLLVPATMRFLGAANWWLPGWLARLHAWMDLREYDSVLSRRLAQFPPPPPRRQKPPPQKRKRAPAVTTPRTRPAWQDDQPNSPQISSNGANGLWQPWPDGRPPARPASAPAPTRRIVPNPDGPGWHWSSAEDDDAS
jgi:trehalose monomycolate/heme transporter